MQDQMLQYCFIVLNINDKAFTYRNVYIIYKYILGKIDNNVI